MAQATSGAPAPVIRYNFNAVPLACIEHEGDLWMLGEDVGRALDYADPAQAVRNIFNRNKSELEGYSWQLKLSCEDGVSNPESGDGELPEGVEKRRPVRVFNEEGVMILTMLSNQPKAAEFRAWAVKILKAYRHGELALTQPAGRENLLITCIKEARFGNPVALHTLIERYGYPDSIRREVKSDLYRRSMREKAQSPELVDWFVDMFLPKLREEIEGEPGHYLAAIRGRPPRNYEWKEVKDEGAIWVLRHRPSDLYGFIVPLAEEEEVDIDITSNRFTRWLTYSVPRLKARGWERIQWKSEKGWNVVGLRMLAEVNHG